ncbi:helix-turn-helix domain-containing protein [Tenacibaculum insulae]|uniref:helix-turn-helix domain-containing protein n=1 Tax=Tenacibaculum insulae TaxID=2029677 RepID=UPI003AB183C3
MNDNSIYKEIIPKDEKLKKLIKYYYLHSSTDPKYFQKITYYPNYLTSLNIYKNSEVTLNEFSRTHEYKKEENNLKILVVKFDVSREIIMKGAFNKITIVFNPLGLNHFLNIPISSITKDYCTLFDYFGKTFDTVIDQVYETENIIQKRDLLDNYFSKHIIGFKEDTLSKAVVKIIENSDLDSVQQIATDLNISRKTLLRLFKKHLLYSPSEYKAIVKFRKTLNYYQKKSNKPNFTALAHVGNYYDQSDLNLHFKNRTGITPKLLLTNIQTIYNDLYWTLESVPKVLSSKIE